MKASFAAKQVGLTGFSKVAALECALCDNMQGNIAHTAREMMLGTKDEFHYLECGACGCLQLLDPPPNMGKYYPSNYYSYDSIGKLPSTFFSPRTFLRTLRNRGYLLGSPVLTAALDKVMPNPMFRSFAAVKLGRDSRILDVGCGSGIFLNHVKAVGFDQLLGIDPFLRDSIRYPNGLEIRKCSLEELTGTTWDLIMFNDSFEHLAEPLATLQTVAALLSQGGCSFVRTPVPARAWKKYGVDWVELDAPRHYFLHTKRSLSHLATKAGLRLTRIDYESDGFMFWGSEMYRKGIPLSALQNSNPSSFFSADELWRFRQAARALQCTEESGRGCFYFSKS